MSIHPIEISDQSKEVLIILPIFYSRRSALLVAAPHVLVVSLPILETVVEGCLTDGPHTNLAIAFEFVSKLPNRLACSPCFGSQMVAPHFEAPYRRSANEGSLFYCISSNVIERKLPVYVPGKNIPWESSGASGGGSSKQIQILKTGRVSWNRSSGGGSGGGSLEGGWSSYNDILHGMVMDAFKRQHCVLTEECRQASKIAIWISVGVAAVKRWHCVLPRLPRRCLRRCSSCNISST